MLDPILDWLRALPGMLMGALRALWRLVLSPFVSLARLYRESGWILRAVILILLIPVLLAYGWFFWHVAWIRDFDVNYPDKYNFAQSMVESGDQVAVEGGNESSKTCGKSRIAEITIDLIDFNVNRNQWISSNPIYKTGFFWAIPWSHTWFFDNKAAFQRGVHQAISRTAVEFADTLGRVRGTSRIDTDLKIAKGNLQFDQYTWYFNPFDVQPFGPTTPTPSYYRKGARALEKFNTRLQNCKATFDARADNLMQFLDRIAKDIGSTSAQIKDRAEQYDSGWFDTRADDIFWFAKGQLYAYYGILKAARADFRDVIRTRQVGDIWSRMEEHMHSAIRLDPMIVSNGREDGWLMPTHLTTLGFYILRARSNLVEIRSVLDR
ncbi:MAG TPA: DUF2333 family protein [Rhizobiales bacterium]|nr:DUF2333 family protein [Hyphomicrobiales bacterium]